MRYLATLAIVATVCLMVAPLNAQLRRRVVYAEPSCPGGVCSAKSALPAVIPTPAFAVTVHYGNKGGSGTVIDFSVGKSLIATAKHFGFAEGNTVSVKAGGETYSGRVAAIDAEADLAMVEVDTELPAAYLADAEPAYGTSVVQWGSPWHANGGFVVKAGQWWGVSDYWATSITSESGDSGAGIFDSQRRLVAVCVGRSAYGQCVTRLAPVRALLARVKARPKAKLVALVPAQAAPAAVVAVPVVPAPLARAQKMPVGPPPMVVAAPPVACMGQPMFTRRTPVRAVLRRLFGR